MTIVNFRYKGSSSSGNRGHAGRPGKVGGSAPKGNEATFDQASLDNSRKLSTAISKTVGKATSSRVAYDSVVESVSKGLSDKTGMKQDEVKDILYGWAFRHLDRNHTVEKLKDAVENDSNAYHGLVRQMYDDTQSQLKTMGFKPTDKIRLYRGISTTAPENEKQLGYEYTHEGETLGSWTYSKAAAKAVAASTYTYKEGRVIEAEVPISQVFSLGTTGVGYTADKEVVLLKSRMPVRVIARYVSGGSMWNPWEEQKELNDNPTINFRYKGSAKSGNYGHSGRPGKVGGSSPRGSGLIESKFGFQEAIVNGNDNIDAKTLDEMRRLYEPTDKQHQEVSKILGMPIGSPQIEPGMRFAYDSTTNKWVISPDSYAHDALRSEAGPSSNEPFEFRQVTGFYDPNANKLYFYDFRDNVLGAEYLAESMGLDVRAVNRKFGAAIYAAKTNLFTANGARPSISYFNEVEGTYDKEWHVKFRYKGSSSSGNRGHAGRPGKVGGSAPKSAAPVTASIAPAAGYVAAKHKVDVTDLPSYAKHENELEQLGSLWTEHDIEKSVRPFVKDIFHDQGFDGKAEVVDKAELDKRIAKGDIELFRGIEASVLPELGKGTRDADYKKQVLQGSRQHANNFRDGDLFIGGGVAGSGTYTTQNRVYAGGYAGDNGVIMRMALRKDAKIISASDARKLPHEHVPSAEVWGWDDGLIAAAAGYDAIKQGDVFLVLNRTALIIQRTNDYEKGLQR